MEYPETIGTFAHFLEDRDLFKAMSDYAKNIVFLDKHNGHGRHFSVQSSAMGCWLSGVCNNWGTNIENWLWWEEGLAQYDELGDTFRAFTPNYINQYPASLMGIDLLDDLVGGATVYCFEQIPMYRFNGTTVEFSPVFYNVLYPLYQKIVTEQLVPQKQQVLEKVKVAYQCTDLSAKELQGNEASLLVDLYASTTEQLQRISHLGGVTKKWVPTTGRYYIIPFLPKYADVTLLAAGTTVLNGTNSASLLGNSIGSKKQFFNDKYAETYTGTATLYDINDRKFIINHHEYQTIDAAVNASFNLANGLSASLILPEHSYAILKDSDQELSLELYNYRYDFRKFMDRKERLEMFVTALYQGERDSNEADFRTTVFSISGLKSKPAITVSGSNNATAEFGWDAASGIATVRVTSNGVAKLTFASVK